MGTAPVFREKEKNRRCPYLVRFNKTGMMRYISHLDLLRLFQRASRRADLPLVFTEGFNPRPRIKVEPALKLGIEGSGLTAEIILSGEISPRDVEKRLKAELPDGIEITEVVSKE